MGQGYVGLPLALRAVEAGFDVIGFDTDIARIKRLADGDSYVEDITDEQLTGALASGRYEPTADPSRLAGFDIAVIDVPTPLRDGSPNLSFVVGAATTLARHLTPGATVVLESTSYPGTTEELVGPLLEEGSGLQAGRDFHLGYSPERIDPGNRTWPLENTPKVVSGIDDASLRAVERLLRPAGRQNSAGLGHPGGGDDQASREHLPARQHRPGQRAGDVRRRAGDRHLGGHRRRVLEALRLHAVHPGPGVGGHCLPIDPSYLSWRVRRALGKPFRFVELANDINEHMPDYVVRRLMLALNRRGGRSTGRRILLLGWPTSATPATPGNPRAVIAQALAAWVPRSGRPTPTSRATPRTRVVDPTAAEVADATPSSW